MKRMCGEVIQRCIVFCFATTQVAKNAFVLVRAIPEDFSAWLEFCDAHGQPALSQGEITPSAFAWMYIGFGLKWPPVVRHSVQLATEDGLLDGSASAKQLYDHVLQLILFADGQAWDSMHANLSYKRQAFSTGLVTFARRMNVIAPASEEEDQAPTSKRRRTRAKPASSQGSLPASQARVRLGKGQTSYLIAPRAGGEAAFQALLDVGAKAQHGSSTVQCDICILR